MPENTDKQVLNAWKMLYRLMDNVKTLMYNTNKVNHGNITEKEVNVAIDYINDSINKIVRNTIG